MGRIKPPSGKIFRRESKPGYMELAKAQEGKNWNVTLDDTIKIMGAVEQAYTSPVLRDAVGGVAEFGKWAFHDAWVDDDEEVTHAAAAAAKVKAKAPAAKAPPQTQIVPEQTQQLQAQAPPPADARPPVSGAVRPTPAKSTHPLKKQHAGGAAQRTPQGEDDLRNRWTFESGVVVLTGKPISYGQAIKHHDEKRAKLLPAVRKLVAGGLAEIPGKLSQGDFMRFSDLYQHALDNPDGTQPPLTGNPDRELILWNAARIIAAQDPVTPEERAVETDPVGTVTPGELTLDPTEIKSRVQALYNQGTMPEADWILARRALTRGDVAGAEGILGKYIGITDIDLPIPGKPLQGFSKSSSTEELQTQLESPQLQALAKRRDSEAMEIVAAIETELTSRIDPVTGELTPGATVEEVVPAPAPVMPPAPVVSPPAAAPVTTSPYPPAAAEEVYSKPQLRGAAQWLTTHAAADPLAVRDMLSMFQTNPGQWENILAGSENPHQLMQDLLFVQQGMRAQAAPSAPAPTVDVNAYRIKDGMNLGQAQAIAAQLAMAGGSQGDLARLLEDVENVDGVSSFGGGFGRWVSGGRKGGYFMDPGAAAIAIKKAYDTALTAQQSGRSKQIMDALRGVQMQKALQSIPLAVVKEQRAREEAASKQQKRAVDAQAKINKMARDAQEHNAFLPIDTYKKWLDASQRALDLAKDLKKSARKRGPGGARVDMQDLRRYQGQLNTAANALENFTRSNANATNNNINRLNQSSTRLDTSSVIVLGRIPSGAPPLNTLPAALPASTIGDKSIL